MIPLPFFDRVMTNILALKLTGKNIPLETAAIFFLANIYLKQGISLEYVMVDIIYMGLLDLWGARTYNYKMKNSCPQ